jgi:hypothetical protein
MPVGKRKLYESDTAAYKRKVMSARREVGLCSCGRERDNKENSNCSVCLDGHKRTRARMRNKILTAYGSKCACCGESEEKFLAIDHVKGEGNQHRRAIGGNKKASTAIYRWIIKNNFPDIFQLLCHNCNMAKGVYGVCPHVAAKAEVPYLRTIS